LKGIFNSKNKEDCESQSSFYFVVMLCGSSLPLEDFTMEVITFHFHRSSTIFGKLVEWRTGSHVAHVSIEVRGYHYNAFLDKRFYRTTELGKNRVESYSFMVSKEVAANAVTILERAIGKLYDVRSMFGFLFNINRQSRGRVYCSEIANDVFELIVPGTVKFNRLISPEIMRIAMLYYSKGLEKQSLTHNRN
jgi:hypothetical protein